MTRLPSRLSGLLQPRIATYSGVAIQDHPPYAVDVEHPNAKRPLLEVIHDVIRRDDDVVHIGGGKGIAAVKTAHWADHGHVTVIEAAQEMCDVLAQTRRLNQVDYDIIHGLVGSPIKVYGSHENATHITPSELDGNILILDCEGAELDILPINGFDVIVVETHPKQGAPTDDVLELLGEGAEIRAEDRMDGHKVVWDDR